MQPLCDSMRKETNKQTNQQMNRQTKKSEQYVHALVFVKRPRLKFWSHLDRRAIVATRARDPFERINGNWWNDVLVMYFIRRTLFSYYMLKD